jgi:hypothetical protein
MASATVVVHRSGRVFTRAKAPNARERGEHNAAGYASGCKCRRCRSAAALADRTRRAERSILRGVPALYWCAVPTAMLEHVGDLRARGWSLRAISAAAGLHPEALGRAMRKGTTSSDTVRRVLAVR